MTSKPVAQLLLDLGVDRSHSRPRVSNDNPSERRSDGSPPLAFGSLADARKAFGPAPRVTAYFAPRVGWGPRHLKLPQGPVGQTHVSDPSRCATMASILVRIRLTLDDDARSRH